MMQLKTVSMLCLASVLLWGSACHTASYSLVSVQGGRSEITSVYDKNPDKDALLILAPYKAKVDSVMSPIIGESEMNLVAYRPESPLSNLIADVLRESAEIYIGRKADVGLVNVGGLRTSLAEGNVTFGNIYRILPFENTLCIVTMTGAQLRQLFENIASTGGEGISGARMVISKDRKLVDVKVDGKPIDEDRIYKVATIDYLAEGNDGMLAFKLSNERLQPKGATLRQLFLDYVTALHKQGKKVTSYKDGRITVK